MRVLRAVAVFALLAGPAYAQGGPHVNLLTDTPSKSQEERDADAEKEKAYKESLRKIPDAKTSSDPWGAVRSTDTPKGTSKDTSKETSKASSRASTKASTAKPGTKTGSAAN
jgi:hypothetical protein